MNIKKYLVELVGTFALSLVVVLAVDRGLGLVTSFIAGITLALFVYSIGSISGAHINPAVTLGAFSINKISWKDALMYIIAQFAGAALALIVISLYQVAPKSPLGIENGLGIGISEAIGAFLFTFGIASVVYGKANHAMSGAVVGGSLFIGIIVALLLGSNGILNPAVAFALHSFGVMYIIGPIVGSVCGMWLYKLLATE